MSTSNSKISNSITTKSSNTPKWSELPKELLEIIGKHLDSRVDVFRFRAVSTLWRSLVPLSHLQSQPITLTLPPPLNATALLSHFTIFRLQHHSLSSACLVKVLDSDSDSGKLRLSNPLISDNFSNNNTINMLDFRLVELTKGCTLVFKKNSFEFKVKKAVLFGREGGIIVLFDSGLLWCWLYGPDDWFHLGKEGARYDDFTAHNDQFYVIDNLGIMFWIDKRTMTLVQYAPPLCGLGRFKTLVVSQGQFYVVDSYTQRAWGNPAHNRNRRRFHRVDIKVYRLDEEWGAWVDVKSLGTRVFVLGKEVSYSVDVRDFPGCPGDCIYFVDPRMEDRYLIDEFKRLVIRVYRFDNGTTRTVDCFPAYKKLFSPSMNWIPTPLSPHSSLSNS